MLMHWEYLHNAFNYYRLHGKCSHITIPSFILPLSAPLSTVQASRESLLPFPVFSRSDWMVAVSCQLKRAAPSDSQHPSLPPRPSVGHKQIKWVKNCHGWGFITIISTNVYELWRLGAKRSQACFYMAGLKNVNWTHMGPTWLSALVFKLKCVKVCTVGWFTEYANHSEFILNKDCGVNSFVALEWIPDLKTNVWIHDET